jgi:hypothetical protein
MLAGRSLLAQIQSQGCCLEVDWTLLLAAVMVFFGEFFDAFSLDSILRAGFFENYYKIMIKLVKRRENNIPCPDYQICASFIYFRNG